MSRDFVTAEDFYGLPVAGRPDAAAEWAVVNFWPKGVPFAMPLGVSPLPPLAVRCDKSRWIVDCPTPDCGGAQMASEGDPRFFCVSCLNAAADARWLGIAWRTDRAEVEDVLRRRHPANRNAFAWETVEDLRRENDEHGVA